MVVLGTAGGSDGAALALTVVLFFSVGMCIFLTPRFIAIVRSKPKQSAVIIYQ